MSEKVDIVICGAGIAGVSTAYQLAVKHAQKDILLLDPLPPLSLTSNVSSECYRNWWPGPGMAMVGLMNRSIKIMESIADESGNAFQLNRRGYLYLTADPKKVKDFEFEARRVEALGAGELRIHRATTKNSAYLPAALDGYLDQPDGADLLLDPALILLHYPFIAKNVQAALHVRKAGWFSGQQLGMYMLEKARQVGVKFSRASVSGIVVEKNRVRAIKLDNGEMIQTGCLILATGPVIGETSRMLGLELPVYCERHLKIAFRDSAGVVPRQAPLLIWADPQTLSWQEEEKAIIDEDPELEWLKHEMPAGAHTRPEGGANSQILLMLWDYHSQKGEPVFPVRLDPDFSEIVLRGLVKMIPGLERYLGKAARPAIDGGYYLKTLENRPLIGGLPVQGAYIIGALSGFGMMAAAGAGELLADCVLGNALPDYATDFSLNRYDQPGYQAQFEGWGTTGQL